MHFLALIVDFLKQLNILSHNFGVFLLVHILVLLKHGSQVVHVVLQVFSLLRVLLVQVGVATFLFHLLLHVLLVQADNSRLQLFKVGDVVQNFENVVFKCLLVALLLV